MVHSELILVAVFCQSGTGSYDAGIADEDVELRNFGGDFLCGFLDTHSMNVSFTEGATELAPSIMP